MEHGDSYSSEHIFFLETEIIENIGRELFKTHQGLYLQGLDVGQSGGG